MADLSKSSVVPYDDATPAGSAHAAPGVAPWLGLAAMPTFALMAAWTGLSSGQPDMLCMDMQGSSPVGGMTMMYLLMCAFHAGPWLSLISGRRLARRQTRSSGSRGVRA